MDKDELYDIIRGKRLIENSMLKHDGTEAFAFWLNVWHEEALAVEWARVVYNDRHHNL